MEGMQGAVLRVKLRHLEAWTEARRAHAELYGQLLAGSSVAVPREMAERRHVYHVYAIRSSRRGELQEALSKREIQTGIHYPIPVHLLGAHSDLGYHAGDFPHSEKAANEVLSLPMYPELADSDIETVAKWVKEGSRHE